MKSKSLVFVFLSFLAIQLNNSTERIITRSFNFAQDQIQTSFPENINLVIGNSLILIFVWGGGRFYSKEFEFWCITWIILKNLWILERRQKKLILPFLSVSISPLSLIFLLPITLTRKSKKIVF